MDAPNDFVKHSLVSPIAPLGIDILRLPITVSVSDFLYLTGLGIFYLDLFSFFLLREQAGTYSFRSITKYSPELRLTFRTHKRG